MSARELKLKINQLSKNIVDVLERENDEEKKVKIFENFYSTLNLIQDMYSPLKNLKRFKEKKL